MALPRIAFGTPRKLPKAHTLEGRVAVLDIAFAAGTAGASYEKTTLRFIDALGDRLAIWIDHHDHVRHVDFAEDPRFVLHTKAEHGACPELVTPTLVKRAGRVDTICCHTDFDGLCAAAKFIRGGQEPYEGADADARAIDTRLGKPGELAETIDRALRARPRDDALKGLVVRFLAEGAGDRELHQRIKNAADALRPREETARAMARGYQVRGDVALVRIDQGHEPYDKTLLLMLGQERARISVVCDPVALTVAARFDSGVNLLELLDLEGGMPTVVSVQPDRIDQVLAAIGWKDD